MVSKKELLEVIEENINAYSNSFITQNTMNYYLRFLQKCFVNMTFEVGQVLEEKEESTVYSIEILQSYVKDSSVKCKLEWGKILHAPRFYDFEIVELKNNDYGSKRLFKESFC